MGLTELLTVVIVLAIVGFAIWLVVTYIPMPDPFKKVIVVVVVLVLLLWVVRALLGSGALRL